MAWQAARWPTRHCSPTPPPAQLPARPLTAGGLTENDFILAAKINDLEFGDLMPPRKQKFWA